MASMNTYFKSSRTDKYELWAFTELVEVLDDSKVSLVYKILDDNWMLVRHGRPDRVKEWFDSEYAKTKSSSLHYITVDIDSDISIQELNKTVSTGTWVPDAIKTAVNEFYRDIETSENY